MAKKVEKPDVARLTVRLERQLMVDLKVQCARRGVAIQEAVSQAVRDWIRGGKR